MRNDGEQTEQRYDEPCLCWTTSLYSTIVVAMQHLTSSDPCNAKDTYMQCSIYLSKPAYFSMRVQTDTASVLHETIEYIKFLHDQVGVSVCGARVRVL